jgi:alginate O-acetyltransferase complex protein AlgJ
MDRPALVLAFAFLLAGHAAQAGMLSEKADAAKTRCQPFVEGSDGWRFLPSELRFADKLAGPDIGTTVQPAVDAIADFSDQLKRAGITLVIMPVPPKVLSKAETLGIDAKLRQQMTEGWNKVMGDVSSRGVQLVDLLPYFSAASEPMFCLRDTHWSGAGIDTAARLLLPALHAAGVGVTSPPATATPWQELSIQGDLGGERETVKLRFPKNVAPQSGKSPVLLLGDSHVLVFHQGGELHTTGAGLPEQMASVLGETPEILGVRGSGATSSRLQMARAMRSNPDYLGTKKVVVWIFAGREFTEADMWKKVPLVAPKSK